ncbi:histone deacetylase [Streptomyces sp. NPDC058877]|uniref:histone deacetylase n=1 Tax=unclassified Streptomyces TaxID=2593676 RepID=UPI0036996433
MSTARPLEPLRTSDVRPQRVWYASYGSNMYAERLDQYLAGGRPPGSNRVYPGCRDRTPPQRSVAVTMPGQVYFATESLVWTGGRGFYDPTADGVAWAVTHLITVQQFADVAAQEMYREPGQDVELTEVLATGRSERGPGRYETLVCPGALEGLPVLTFTAPWRMADTGVRRPATAYVRQLAHGLKASSAWSDEEIAGYLSDRPGARGHLTPDAVMELLADGAGRGSR